MITNLNSPMIDPKVYNGLAAFTTQSYTEINSKNGTQYEGQVDLGSVNVSSSKGFSFTTNDSPVLVKFRQVSGEFSDITYTIYKDASVSGGNQTTYGNLNDISPVAGTVVILENPLVSDTGVLATQPKRILGDAINKVITYGSPQGERVLKTNTTYYVTVTNNSNNIIPKILIDLGWYEGALDIDLRVSDTNCP